MERMMMTTRASTAANTATWEKRAATQGRGRDPRPSGLFRQPQHVLGTGPTFWEPAPRSGNGPLVLGTGPSFWERAPRSGNGPPVLWSPSACAYVSLRLHVRPALCVCICLSACARACFHASACVSLRVHVCVYACALCCSADYKA